MEKGTTLKNCLLLQQQGVISTGFIAYLKHTTTQIKAICPKYYKKYAYTLAHKVKAILTQKGRFRSKDLQFSQVAQVFNVDATMHFQRFV